MRAGGPLRAAERRLERPGIRQEARRWPRVRWRSCVAYGRAWLRFHESGPIVSSYILPRDQRADLRLQVRQVSRGVSEERIHRGPRPEGRVLSQVQVDQCLAGHHRAVRKGGQEKLVFERLKNAINAALAANTPAPDPKAQGGLMKEAAVEARSAVELMKCDLALAEKQLAAEQAQLADATRRGEQAKAINDQETVDVAER